MQTIGTWKRFRPIKRGRLDDKTVYERESVYVRARDVVEQTLRDIRSRENGIKRSAEATAYLKNHPTSKSEYLLARLIVQAPGAARAQREMDTHHGGYKNRQARLFELIDFNDTFVDTVLSLSRDQLRTFTVRCRAEIDTYCEQVGVKSFDDRQFEAIVHGLSREIAVYRGAIAEGFRARMTSRVQDSMGIDMIITDPATKKSLSIDVKTDSAFHFRLLDLQHSRRIDESVRMQCELAGFCAMRNGHGYRAVDTVLLRIDTDRLGEINYYEFADTRKFGELLRSALKHYGKYIV